MPAASTGTSGVLIVAESAGADEVEAGEPLVGKAGQYLFGALKRVGLEREQFKLHNVLSCQPPGNLLVKMPYEEGAISHCSPNLDATIAAMQLQCKDAGQTLTILTLGRVAFKRVLGIDDKSPLLRYDYQVYPHWSEKYQAYVIAADHPSYLMRGNHSRLPILQFAAQRAIEIAKDGLTLETPTYLCDPTPFQFKEWATGYFDALLADASTVLTYDIETPYKSGKDEEEVAREDDDDYTILRVSFSYKEGEAVSVRWSAEYMATIERIFQAGGIMVGWNSSAYDDPRIMAQMPMRATLLDGMIAWHVLNTTLPKGLGFVTPFYAPRSPMWKHRSAIEGDEAYYSAADADMTLRCFNGIRRDLISNNLDHVFERHVVQLNKVLSYMSGKGVKLDQEMRADAEVKLSGLLESAESKMQSAVPMEALKLKVYKKVPKVLDGLVQTTGKVKMSQCPSCLMVGVKIAHMKSIGKKKLKLGDVENPCFGVKPVKVEVETSLWAAPQPFRVSKVSLMSYQKTRHHQPILSKKERKVTFDENAMKSLVKKYPTDPLYPIIGEFRGVQKLLGTYVGVTNPETGRIKGGMPIGRDGRIHTTFSHNPSTLRLASQNPNLQNLPRGGGPDALQSIIRNLVVADDGHMFLARDFSGIEAVLVGYEARDPSYVRLALRDVHSYYTIYAIYELDRGRIPANDLPLLSWDDTKLFSRLAEIKKEFKEERNSLYKHLVHAINFGQGAVGAQSKIYQETDVIHPTKKISRVMDVYRELFPSIPKWHRDVRLQADRDGYLRNAFSYVHRFNRVFEHKKEFGKWIKYPGDDAEAVLAFKPQSTAAGIIKEAVLRLYFDRYEEAGQYLRLMIHDEVFGEVPEDKVEQVDRVFQEEMEKPIPELELPESWGMGPFLHINTEPKMGKRWGEMH